MTAIASHLSSAELVSRYKAAADAASKSHFHALCLLSMNYQTGEVAQILSFSPRRVQRLVKRYNVQGPDSLSDRRLGNGSAPAILTEEALASLKERLKTRPDDGRLWTGPKVARWLAGFHGLKSVHNQRGWDALIAIEYSIQTARYLLGFPHNLSYHPWSDLDFGHFPRWKLCDGPSHVSVCGVTSDLSGPVGVDLTDFPISMAPGGFGSDDPSDYDYSHSEIAALKGPIYKPQCNLTLPALAREHNTRPLGAGRPIRLCIRTK
jgi:transposase